MTDERFNQIAELFVQWNHDPSKTPDSSFAAIALEKGFAKEEIIEFRRIMLAQVKTNRARRGSKEN